MSLLLWELEEMQGECWRDRVGGRRFGREREAERQPEMFKQPTELAAEGQFRDIRRRLDE